MTSLGFSYAPIVEGVWLDGGLALKSGLLPLSCRPSERRRRWYVYDDPQNGLNLLDSFSFT